MAGSSNRDLWQVVTGHSALRDEALIEREVRDFLPRLKEGVAYYRPPSSGAGKRVREGGSVRGKKLALVLDLSSHLKLDQEQALELFEGYLINAHRGTLHELDGHVRSDSGRREVVKEVTTYYHTERLHLLHCLKHMLGFWQDPNHPFRNVYTVCIGEMTVDETAFIQSLWRQYKTCVEHELPEQLSASEERQWVVQGLVEQVELLEAIVLYYKDFVHRPPDLLSHAHCLHEYGFGLRQNSKASLVEGAGLLQQHIGHLCSLILVESFDLDFVLANLEDKNALRDHHLFGSSTTVRSLDVLFSEWGDQDCHTPVLLAWALVNFAIEEPSEGLEAIRLLGNRALSGGVFGFMRSLLSSPFFSKERPVSGVCKSVVHTLLSLALTQFSEDSLGDYQDLVAIAAQTLTHPPLRLQFWEQGVSVGVGVLLSSALSHFPFISSPLSSLLLSLAGDEVCAGHVWQFLATIPRFTEQLPHKEIGKQVHVVSGEDRGEPGLVVVKPRSFYSNEAQWLGCHGIVMAVGVRGEVWEGWGGECLVSWPLSDLCGWTVLALQAVRLLHTPLLDSSAEELVARVTETICLVTQMMKSDWLIATALYPITSKVFSMLQRFSVLPQPPCTLLASCLSCVAVMATKNTAETWSALGRTGFLPSLTSSHTTVTANLDHITVCPGHYGQLLKMVECPEGSYPISMAMLDLLATTCVLSNSPVSMEQLATVVYVMKEVFTCCNRWRYRLRSDRDDLELKLLRLCHDTLDRHRTSPNSLGVVITTALLRCPGERGILPLLSLPVATLNTLHSAALGTSSVSPCVESVRLSLSILTHLLHSPESSLLEWNLANTHPHSVSNIASYIHHHGDTRIPIAATALLTRLCQTAPQSVCAALGTDAIVKRDAFVARLSSRVEEDELKRGILSLLCEAVTSQPALAELFLCIHSAPGQVQYSLRESSCLHPVLKVVRSGHEDGVSPLLPPSLQLLRCLWHGRHDAVLHALRETPSFWKHMTTPLLHPPDLTGLSSDRHDEVTNQLLSACHVMHIVAMEMYYVFQDRLDSSLQAVLKEFISKNGIKNWNQCVGYSESGECVLQAQQQVVTAWKTFMMVASRNQPSLFGLPTPASPSPSPSPSPSTVCSSILTDILTAIESHLAASVSMPTVSMASELSLLMMVFIKHWERYLPVGGDLIGQFSDTLPHVMRLDPVQASPLTLHLYTSIHLLLGSAHTTKVSVGNRFLLGLIPFLAHTLRSRHDNSKGPSHRPDVAAMHLLSEMMVGVSDWLPWLHAFRNESLIPLLVQMVEERLKLQSDEPLIEAILGVFITMATSRAGAESLLVSGCLQVLSLPLCGCLDNKLNPAPLTSQPPGTPVLKPHPPSGWSSVWQLSVRVAGLMCHTLPHLSLPALLDFTGTHEHRLLQSLDIMVAIHSLQALQTTRSCVCFIQHLFRQRRQLCFSLPSFHNTAVSCILTLLAATATVLSRGATLRHIIKTMSAAGLLPSNYGPPPAVRGRVQLVNDEAWAAGSGLQVALKKLQSGLVSILLSCLCTIQHFSPSLSDIVMATGQLEKDEYPAMFQPVLTPPTLGQTTPPSLGTLTTCLSVGLYLLKKLDPHKLGTPSKSSSKSPSKSPRPSLSPADQQQQKELLCMLEHAVVLSMGQALCLMSGHSLSPHDKQLLCKELANELGSFCRSLLLIFNRRGTPSSASSQAPPTSFQEGWSGKSTLTFTETCEQVIFRITDSFTKQLLN